MPTKNTNQKQRTSEEIRDAYTDRIRDAMELRGDELADAGVPAAPGSMRQEHYIEALETIVADIRGMLEAARGE